MGSLLKKTKNIIDSLTHCFIDLLSHSQFLIPHSKFLILPVLLTLSLSVFAEDAERTVINITNARQTSYKKDEATGNDTIILEGSVVLSVTKGDTSSEIKADRITYDRKTEMLFADGNVEITTKGSNAGGETTTANTLLLNTSTLEGVFDGGRVVQTQSDALNLPSGSTLIVFSDILGKGENNTIAFKNSSLTFCDEEDPHWHIDATRTWLLPGGEFAFFNAFLYVGVIPVLYLPAFYYPKDELIFNPVFGIKKREGYFFQTTTYLYGRKPLDSSSSTDSNSSSSEESLRALYNFMKPSTLKEQKREGLVLHNLDQDYTGNTSEYFKVMADWYSTLGGMIGFDGNFQPSSTYVTKLNFNGYIGFSNTVFRNSAGKYMPYHPKSGAMITDGSNLLGFKTEGIRYGGNLEFALSKPFKLTLSLPVYSDPYFSYDFKEREETMDWISFFLDNTSSDGVESTISEVSSYTWALSASYSPSLPSFIKPYLSSISLSLNSSVNVSSAATSFTTYQYDPNDKSDKQDKVEYEWSKNTPLRKFYYPSQITPASVSFSMSGTLFQWPLPSKSDSTKTPSYAITMNKPEDIKSESEKQKEQEEKEKAQKNSEDKEQTEKQEEETKQEELKDEDFITLLFPTLDYTPANNTEAQGLTYNLGYSINANISTQLAYDSSKLKRIDDFEWNNVRASIYTIKAPMTLTSALNYGGSFFALTNKFTFDPIWQKHPVISTDLNKGGYTEEAKKALILADYNAESRNILNTNTISFKPFTYTKHFADTGISWNSNIKLYRKKFLGDVDNPQWEDYTLDWNDDECVTVNSMDYVLGASEYNNKIKQTLTFTNIMPPLLRQYNATLNLIFPYVTTSFSSGYKETSKDQNLSEEDRWTKSPFQQSMTISLFNSSLKISESYNYNLQDKNHDSLKLSASWKSLQLSYVMQYTQGADLNTNIGWINRVNPDGSAKKEFLPYSISFSFTPSTKTYYKWFNRISIAPGLNMSLVADMIKPTNSYLLFSPSISFKITDFFTLTFSSTSRNSILYWYFHEGMYDEWGGFPGNAIKDLINSFRFDDRSLREGSGFKLKSLNMTMTHELHDWKFNMTFKVEPRLVTEGNVTNYDFSPYITIGVVWNPMESMKTEIVDEYGEWKLNNE